MFYFIICPYIYNNKQYINSKLECVSNLILDLSKNVNNNNFYTIVKFFQENKFYSNNKLIDIIKTEKNEKKLELLINNYNNNKNIDYYSSGYVVELFRIFYNDYNFCIKKIKLCHVYYVVKII